MRGAAMAPSVMRRAAAILAVLASVLVLSGHVGNDAEYLVGRAGPYPVHVVVRLPGVIPGLAQVSVQVDADDVRSVGLQPLYWRAVENAPAAERARLVPGETRLWTSEVWLMAYGSYGLRVVVDGAQGTGEVIMPVNAVPTRTLEMQRTLGLVLAGLGAFLVVGMLTVVRAASSDALLPPGEEPDRRVRRRSWIATGVAAVVIALGLVGGNAWWRSVDADYRTRVARPVPVSTVVDSAGTERVLSLTITDTTFARGTPLIPDHGKLMHLFLVREPGLDVFAHLHPQRTDTLAFAATLPPLPEGRYRLYADVVRASGFVITLQDMVDIGASASDAAASEAWLREDPDASWYGGDGMPAALTTLEDGSTMLLGTGDAEVRAGRPVLLRAEVRAPDATPAKLEPYLGMLGHAVITREDGTLFVHLHPTGTISVAAKEQFVRRTAGDTALVPSSWTERGDDTHAGHGAAASHVVEFPYVFPAEGVHRVWIQVRREGRNLTGAFDVVVVP